MFETLSISTETVGAEQMIDALCFFERVRFCGNPARLVALIRKLGPENARRLVEAQAVSLVAERHRYAVIQSNPALPIFDSGMVSLAADAGGRKIRSAHDELEIMYVRALGKDRSAIKFFQDALVELPPMQQVLEQARKDFSTLIT